nr:ATP-binding protein [uncultured Rhodoferax sp.]
MPGKVLYANAVRISLYRLASFCILALAVWLGGTPIASASVCDTPTHITQAQREVTLNGRVIDQATVSIPDKLAIAWRREGIKIRYTLDVGECSKAAEQTLWLPRVGGPYQLSMQGHPTLPIHPFIELTRQEQTDLPTLTFNGRSPMLFRIPNGAHQVSVELQTLPYIPTGISRAEHGSFDNLFPKQMQAYSDAAGGMSLVSLVTFVIGIAAIALWRTRKRDLFILWFGYMCLLWGIRGYFYASDLVILPPLLFEQLNPMTVSLFAVACYRTTLLIFDKDTPKARSGLLGIAVFFVTAFSLSLAIGWGALLIKALSFGFGLLILTLTHITIWRNRSILGSWRTASFMLGFFALEASGIHDVLAVAGQLSADRNSLILHGFTVLLIAYAVICVHFVVLTLNQAEASNELLETRVREKTRALEKSYEKLRSIELIQAQVQERERLLRDMHDGVGAQLMTALRGLERGMLDKEAISHALQDGLDDLRMLMDNADPQATLTNRLAAWRNRWDARLTSLGLQLHWQLSDDIDDIVLPGDTSLQLLRVVQEACTNVIKHANATHIWLTARCTEVPEGPMLYIEVRDNGRGVDATCSSKNGRGKANMHFRAKQIGAYLAIEPPPLPDNGCCVRLWLPWPT